MNTDTKKRKNTNTKTNINKKSKNVYKKYSDALDIYKLTSADLKVTLFAVEKRLYYVDDLVSMGWNKFALKGVSKHAVPGDHKTVLYPPNSEKFARTLQQVLNNELQKKD